MPYITTPDLRSYIGLTGTQHDTVLDQFILSASERCDTFTYRVKGLLGSGFLTHSNLSEVHWLRDQRNVVLQEWPVDSIQSIKLNGESLVQNTDYILDSKPGIITFIGGSGSYERMDRWGQLEVDYVAGFQTTPYAVKLACFRAGAYWFARKGSEGMGAQLIGDMQETFRIPEINRILHEELSDFILEW